MTLLNDYSILAYLESLPPATLQRLWTDTPSVLTIYRFLSPIAHQIIARLLLMKSATPFETVRRWHPPSKKPLQNAALIQMKKLQILQGKSGEVWLNPVYRASLIKALSGDLEIVTAVAMNDDDGDDNNNNTNSAPPEGETTWERLLFAIVTGSFKKQKGSLREVMVGAGLLSSETGFITSVGFQFLLLPRHQQLWMLIIQFLIMSEASGLDLVATMMSFFRLVLLTPGTPTTVTDLTIDFLSDVGLVKKTVVGRKPREQAEWVVTDLLFYLGNPLAGMEDAKSGYIIIETNYKLYAYTASPLQIAILGLFVHLKDRFQNMIHGQLTGPSVQAAFSKGITANQIISFIKLHLHPSMQQTEQLALPSVIEDQIHLWERDKRRLRTATGYLYQEFASEEELKRTANEAQRLNSLLYVNYQKRILVVNEESHPAIKAFFVSEISHRK